MEGGVQYNFYKKDAILIVGDYSREDFLYNAKVLSQNFEIFFLEYQKSNERETTKHLQIGKAIYWNNYKHIDDLLIKIQPKLIIFYFIESYYHVLLNAIAKERGIKTFLLDHGLRDYKFLADFVNYTAHSKAYKPSIFGELQNKMKKLSITRVSNWIKFEIFQWRTLEMCSKELNIFYKGYRENRKHLNAFYTHQKVKSKYRNADYYFCFSKKTFEFHKINDGITEESSAKIIGLPYFDKLFDKPSFNTSENIGAKALLIDENVQTLGYLGWNEMNYFHFVQELALMLKSNNIQLLVKLHPYGDLQFWEKLERDGHLQILKEDFFDVVHDIKLFFGHFSSLLVPLASMKHTVVVSLKFHPNKDVCTDDIIDSNAIISVKDFSDLNKIVIGTYSKDIDENKRKLKDYYNVDGKAGLRMINILEELIKKN